MSAISLHFSCPHCGNRKLWKSELAGKRAKCGCGHILIVPTGEELGLSEDDSELLLAEALEPKESVARPPTRVTVDPTRLMHRKPLKREIPVSQEHVFSIIRDGVLPAILIVVGVAVSLAAESYQGEGKWLSIQHVIGPVTINIVTGLALVIGAVFAASAMGGIAFQESPRLVIYKLCAIALAPGAIGQITQTYLGGINGDMAAVLVSLACYVALFMLLFKLAMSDRVVCITLIFIIRAAVTYMIFRLQGAKAGSPI